MYSRSAWFRALLGYVSQRFKVILISSAKYGLVYLSDIIDSYDFNVAHRDPVIREAAIQLLPEWGRMVGDQFKKMFPAPYSQYTLYLYVGKNYAEQITMAVPPEVSIKRPLSHLGQGSQVKYCLEMSKKPLPLQHKAVWISTDGNALKVRPVTFRVTDRNFAYTDDLDEVQKIPKEELFKPSVETDEIGKLWSTIDQARLEQWRLLDKLTPYF